MRTTQSPRVLIAYGTCEGHTADIAEYIADVIRNRGGEAEMVELSSSTPELDGYDAVIVGASIHMGRHESCVRYFVRRNRAELERLPSAFFSVSLIAHDNTDAARGEVEGYIQKFVNETGWRPARISVFAGALLYTHYGFFKRWMMRKIARNKGSPDLDTSRDYVYTDWDGVRRFAEEFLDTLVSAGVPERAVGS